MLEIVQDCIAVAFKYRFDRSFLQDFVFIFFVLSNEIKIQSLIHPVENSPLSKEKKIN